MSGPRSRNPQPESTFYFYHLDTPDQVESQARRIRDRIDSILKQLPANRRFAVELRTEDR